MIKEAKVSSESVQVLRNAKARVELNSRNNHSEGDLYLYQALDLLIKLSLHKEVKPAEVEEIIKKLQPKKDRKEKVVEK